MAKGKKPKIIKLDICQVEVDHIFSEPRFTVCIGKTEETLEILEPLKGPHDGDLALELKPEKKKFDVLIAEIKGHVSVKRKWIMGKYWSKYYSIRFEKNMDGTLKIWKQ